MCKRRWVTSSPATQCKLPVTKRLFNVDYVHKFTLHSHLCSDTMIGHHFTCQHYIQGFTMQASWRNTSAEATYTVASVLLSTALVLPYRSSIATIAVPLKGTHTVGFGMILIVSILYTGNIFNTISRRQQRRLRSCPRVIALVPLKCSGRNLQRCPSPRRKLLRALALFKSGSVFFRLPWCPVYLLWCPLRNSNTNLNLPHGSAPYQSKIAVLLQEGNSRPAPCTCMSDDHLFLLGSRCHGNGSIWTRRRSINKSILSDPLLESN